MKTEIKRDNNLEVKGFKLFLGYLGLFLIFIGTIILVPLFLLIFYPNEWKEFHLFLGPAVIALAIGFPLYFLFCFKKNKARLEKWQSYLLLIVFWIVSIFFASLPFMITDDFNFTQAIFEATSGFTTTAISLLSSEALLVCSHIFIFYRVWLLFVGGIGLTLVLTSAISDANGLSIYNLEGHNDRLLPNLIKSARIIFVIYFIYIGLGILAYWLCGMPIFEAVCNSISGLSTGGFMCVPGGIGSYNSLPIEIVTIVLMLLGSTNFMIHFNLISLKFKKAFYHCEFISFIFMFIIFVPILIIGYNSCYGDVAHAFRHGIFNFVSAVTSSGFILGDAEFLYANMPYYMTVVIIFCMVIGGQAGSTSGGIKQMRLVLIIKQIYWSIRSLNDSPHLIPSHTIIRYGKKECVDSKEFVSSAVYLYVYIGILIIGTFILCCFGYSFQESLFEYTAILSTTGYSIGIMSYTASAGVLWVGIIGMIIGRLEPLIFLMLISKGVKSANDSIRYKLINKNLKNS